MVDDNSPNTPQQEHTLAVWQQLYSLFDRRTGLLRGPNQSSASSTIPADSRKTPLPGIPPVWEEATELLRPLPNSVLELLRELTDARLAHLQTRLRYNTRAAMIALPALILLYALFGNTLLPAQSPLAFLGLHSPHALPLACLAIAILIYLCTVRNVWMSMQRTHKVFACLEHASHDRHPTEHSSR